MRSIQKAHPDASDASDLLSAAEEKNDTGGAKVRFVNESEGRKVSLLEIEYGAGTFGHVELRAALFDLRVQILGSPWAQSVPSVERFLVVEFDGAVISRPRQREVCRELVIALGLS